jgi:hypothetical protein
MNENVTRLSGWYDRVLGDEDEIEPMIRSKLSTVDVPKHDDEPCVTLGKALATPKVDWL